MENPRSEISPDLLGKIEKVREQFADEWEELVTGPGVFGTHEMQFGEVARRGEKLPKHRWVEDKLVRICQDLRLTPDDIDVVLATLVEQ